MAMTVRTPQPPVTPVWFENIQMVSRWYACNGPRYPRGSSN